MSELEAELQELRDGMRASIVRPDLGRVAGRARQRTVRRRMQVGAITAVVLVSVAVPVLRSVPSDERPAGQTPAGSVRYDVDFADTTHGYALGRDCEDPDGPCTFTMLVTVDRGLTWRARKLPAADRLYHSGQLLVVDADRLRFTRMPFGINANVEAFASDDAGRTWRRNTAAVGPARPIPAGAALQRVCIGSGTNGCVIGVGTYDGDGLLFPAPAQPPAEIQEVGREATAGGRFWVASEDRATRAWSLSVTSDAGRTWVTRPMDLPGDPWPQQQPWSVVEGGGVLYATAQGSIGHGPFGLLAAFRSTDGGASWSETWRATPETLLTAVAGSPLATPDGRLVLYSTTDGTYESTDGRRFSPSDRQLPGPVTWTRAGYLAKVADDHYELSSDGLHWRTIRLT
jgi:hypothetical protein